MFPFDKLSGSGEESSMSLVGAIFVIKVFQSVLNAPSSIS